MIHALRNRVEFTAIPETWDGHAAERIVDVLLSGIGRRSGLRHTTGAPQKR
jgi:hypothetical protein